MATGHITDDDLELNAIGRLPEADAALVEEHLLACQECRERLAEWDAYVLAMREAGAGNPNFLTRRTLKSAKLQYWLRLYA
jgi:anti-sigma factor RsiW